MKLPDQDLAELGYITDEYARAREELLRQKERHVQREQASFCIHHGTHHCECTRGRKR